MLEFVKLVSTSGRQLVAQPTSFGQITNLDTADFSLPNDAPFTITNDADADITLEVIPADAVDGVYIPKKFRVGDNSFLVKKIKITATANTLIWGN